jgi:hypothetical protein
MADHLIKCCFTEESVKQHQDIIRYAALSHSDRDLKKMLPTGNPFEYSSDSDNEFEKLYNILELNETQMQKDNFSLASAATFLKDYPTLLSEIVRFRKDSNFQNSTNVIPSSSSSLLKEGLQMPETKTIFLMVAHEGIKQSHVWQAFFEASHFGFVVYCSKKHQPFLTPFFSNYVIYKN